MRASIVQQWCISASLSFDASSVVLQAARAGTRYTAFGGSGVETVRPRMPEVATTAADEALAAGASGKASGAPCETLFSLREGEDKEAG